MSLKKLIILSGAGMSAESGLKTFRDSDGLWEEYKIKEVATPEAWKSNPELVQKFYNLRRKQILEAKPNKAHLFLKELESYFDVQIITQNIDDLHERAGSLNVLHLHGNITLAKSSGPNKEKKYYPINGWEIKMNDFCDNGFVLRPHVVWFGEEVPNLTLASKIIEKADILLIIGTSLQVYPASNLVYYCDDKCKIFVVDPNLIKISSVKNDIIFIKETAVNSIPILKDFLFKN